MKLSSLPPVPASQQPLPSSPLRMAKTSWLQEPQSSCSSLSSAPLTCRARTQPSSRLAADMRPDLQLLLPRLPLVPAMLELPQDPSIPPRHASTRGSSCLGRASPAWEGCRATHHPNHPAQGSSWGEWSKKCSTRATSAGGRWFWKGPGTAGKCQLVDDPPLPALLLDSGDCLAFWGAQARAADHTAGSCSLFAGKAVPTCLPSQPSLIPWHGFVLVPMLCAVHRPRSSCQAHLGAALHHCPGPGCSSPTPYIRTCCVRPQPC